MTNLPNTYGNKTTVLICTALGANEDGHFFATLRSPGSYEQSMQFIKNSDSQITIAATGMAGGKAQGGLTSSSQFLAAAAYYTDHWEAWFGAAGGSVAQVGTDGDLASPFVARDDPINQVGAWSEVAANNTAASGELRWCFSLVLRWLMSSLNAILAVPFGEVFEAGASAVQSLMQISG